MKRLFCKWTLNNGWVWKSDTSQVKAKASGVKTFVKKYEMRLSKETIITEYFMAQVVVGPLLI